MEAFDLWKNQTIVPTGVKKKLSNLIQIAFDVE